ncbi:YfgM family protein [Alkalisalibacterium limincola]|nr:tetratricopeptide repeat protein [Alkalisalibacterium limincola]
MDEHEQGELVRAWLRQNGATIVTGILVGVAAILGWNWWQTQQANKAFAAGTEYHRMVIAAEGGDLAQARAHSEAIQSDFGDSPYAVLAALRQASLEVAQGDHEAAIATLEAARGRNADPALDELLALRKARLQIAAGDHEQALSLLEGVGAGYAGMAHELRGDALQALGRDREARMAYVDALTHLDSAAPSRALVEFKLNDLGGSVDAPEA